MEQCWRMTLGCLFVAQVVIGQSNYVVNPNFNQYRRNTNIPKLPYTNSTLPIEIMVMRISSTISMRYAYTEVITHVRNPAQQAQQTTFKLLLPDTAFISGFTMTIDNKEYKAYVKAKEEANEIYTEAVKQGLSAATVTAKVRDSNRFMITVNLEPNSKAVFNLTYEELLKRRNGVYNHAINLHPGGLVPELTVKVHIKESQKITMLRVPEIRTGNEVDADLNDPQYPEPTITRNKDNRQAIVTFKPDLNEQKKLMAIYNQKTKDLLSRRTQLYHTTHKSTTEGILGQFVVQYDVFRPEEGELIVNKGYFAEFLSAPDSTPSLNKYVVFVLDTSESMSGKKIAQLKQSMAIILNQLNKADYFSIVEFGSVALVHELDEANFETQPTTIDSWILDEPDLPLAPPYQATSENVANAQTIIRRLEVAGGTNIGVALDAASQLIDLGVDSEENNVNNDLEKMIIFLTDGEPTVGTLSPKMITKDFTKKNDGGNKALLFTLGFGQDADTDFLQKLATSNNGFARHIYEASDAAVQLNKFFKQVSDPVFSDVSITYPSDQVVSESLTDTSFPIIFRDSEELVLGYLVAGATQLSPRVSLSTALRTSPSGTKIKQKKRKEIYPKTNFAIEDQNDLRLERLWAYVTIRQLLNQRDIAEFHDSTQDTENGLEKKALKLALQYGFVTPITSLVVVKPEGENVVNAESSDVKKGQFSSAGDSGSGPVIANGQGQYNSQVFGQGQFDSQGYGQDAIISQGHGVMVSHEYNSVQVVSQGFQENAIHQEVYVTTPLPTGPAFAYWPDRPSIFNSTPPVYLPPLTTEMPINFTASLPPRPTIFSTPFSGSLWNNLKTYNAEEYPWFRFLLDQDGNVKFWGKQKFEHLKLTRDLEVPRELLNDRACDNAIGGGFGRCVYLTRCETAKNITMRIYPTTYCSVKNVYAGICCPLENEQNTAPITTPYENK